jgi:NCS2 family nucleobase:cation symporter-2
MEKSELHRKSPDLFQLNGKPKWGIAAMQAMQHIIAMLAGNITPPILIANALNLSSDERIMLVQAAMLIGGITTLLQLFPVFGFGMGLPNVMGVAFAYMPVLMTIGLTNGIGAIFGAQLIAAFVSIFIGMGIGKIRKFFPPIVSGTVVLSIGLSLYGSAVTNMAGGNGSTDFGSYRFWVIAVIVLSVTLACNLFGKGYIKLSGILIGIGAGYIASLIIGAATGTPMVFLDSVKDSAIFAFPKFFHFKMIFDPASIMVMILMYVVQAVQTIGDVSSTAIGAFGREASDKEIGGAIKMQGVTGMIGSLIGGLPTDPYSQNVGLIVTTKVVAKRVFVIVGGLLVVIGMFPVLGAAIITVPYPVLGGATISVFAAITMSGIQLITEQPLNYRNKMIVGISLALGVGITMVSKAVDGFPAAIRNVIGSSPIILAFLTSFVLNIVTPPDDTPADD